MTSLRFQLIALVSVTVALTVGLVVGALARHAPAGPAGSVQLNALQGQNQLLQSQLDQLTGNAPAPDQAAIVEQVAPTVLEHRLAGVSVLILGTPSGAPAMAGVARMLELAGATPTGQLLVTDAFADPTHRDDLLDLATAALPPSVTIGLPVTTDGVVAASAVLADVLLKRTPVVTPGDLRSVLTAFASQGYLAAGAAVTGPADAVVVVAGAAGTGTAALSTLVGQLRAAGPVVLGADGAEVTDALRGGATKVSTVDNVGTVPGQLICVWALADELTGDTGRYGRGALPPMPPPRGPAAPATPTPPPTVSPTVGPSAHPSSSPVA